MTPPHALPPDADDWLADFPDMNRADLEEPWRLAEGVDPLGRAPAPDPNRIARIQNGLEQAARSASPRAALRRLAVPARRWPWLAAAACLGLLVVAGLLARMVRPLTVSAPYGTVVAVELPDGSRVELNAGSSLVYPRSFDTTTRRVHLDGEAFFDVARAPAPFVIETFNADVIVRGTSFNVRAWPTADDAQTVVAVVTGVVEVAARTAPDRRVALHPGQTTRVLASEPVPTPPTLTEPDTEAIAWRVGGFYFDNQTYGAIFDEVERRYGVDISAPPSIRSRRRTFTKQRTDDARAFLDDFCASVGLRYRPTATGFEVFAE